MKVELTDEELRLIFTSLSEMPHKMVNGLINKLVAEVNKSAEEEINDNEDKDS